MMAVKCKGGHRHVQLMAGRARAATHYPAKFCKALCKGMKRQAKVDASGMLSTLILEGGWAVLSLSLLLVLFDSFHDFLNIPRRVNFKTICWCHGGDLNVFAFNLFLHDLL